MKQDSALTFMRVLPILAACSVAACDVTIPTHAEKRVLLEGSDARASAPAPEAEQGSVLSRICNLKPGDVPIKLMSQQLVIRFNAYARMELVGPQSCLNVAFRFSDPALSIRYNRLMKARADKKEYSFLQQVIVDGVAYYDAEWGRVRIDVDKMVGLPDV